MKPGMINPLGGTKVLSFGMPLSLSALSDILKYTSHGTENRQIFADRQMTFSRFPLETVKKSCSSCLPRRSFSEGRLILSDKKTKKNPFLFSDEIYRESEYRAEDRLPAACDKGEHAVSLGVMSKTYGLPGLRIGWIATQDANIYAWMAALKDYTTICNSAPSEFLAELALRHRTALVKLNMEIITGNLADLDQFFVRHADRFVWHRPKAGAIGFPQLLGEDVENFYRTLVQTAAVLLLPGTVYDDAGNHFRIGYGRKNFPDAIERLEEFLRK